MTNTLPPLQKGDLIRIVAPAKTIDSSYFMHAKERFETAGYRVVFGENAMGQHNYFSGTDEERIADMQTAIDDEQCKLIVCARGGYGSIRVVDGLDWSGFQKNPKWFCGFSDITIFLHRILRLGFPCLHATMPLNYAENTIEALDSFFCAITGKENEYVIDANVENVQGKIRAELVGGNLSVLYSLIGTNDKIDYANKILFIEDVGEQFYTIDRMLFSLKKAGILNEIAGLIVGGMTKLSETPIPTKFKISEIVLQHFKERNIPIGFDFPAGHFNDNRALIFGSQATLEINASKLLFKQ